MTNTVEEFISGKLPVVSITLNDSLKDAVRLMLRHDYSQLPVVDSEKRLIGLVTSDSILKALNNYGAGLEALLIKHVLIKKLQMFRQDIDLLDLFDEMNDPFAGIIDEEGRLVQLLTTYDVTDYFRQRARDIILVENIESILREYVQLLFTNKQDGESRLNKAIQSLSNYNLALQDNFSRAVRYYLRQTGQNGGNQINKVILDETFQKHLDEKRPPITFDELTLGNYISLFLHNDHWPYLEEVFGLKKPAIINLLDSVRATRNDLAHFREIGADQSRQLRDCYDLLVEHEGAIRTLFLSQTPLKTDPTLPIRVDHETGAGTVIPTADEPYPGESRYATLAIWLQEQPTELDVVTLSFKEIEKIIGGELPQSAYKNRSWWSNDTVGHVQSQQWLGVGWRVAIANRTDEWVRFSRIAERQRAYIDFYNALDQKLRKLPGFEQLDVSPDGSNWHSVKGIGWRGQNLALLIFAFGRNGTFRIELYIDSGDGQINKSLFDALHLKKDEIEEELGHGLDWQRLDNRRASKVSRVLEASITDSPEELMDLAEKASKVMVLMLKILEPRVLDIGQRLLSSTSEPNNAALNSRN